MTFASLPLTMMGGWINLFTQWDRNPGFDLADVQKDIPAIAARGDRPVAWRWYQNGYDREPTDTGLVVSHKAYVSHHNGAQYFGYIANNAVEQMNLRGEGDFFADLAKGRAAGNRRGVHHPRRLLQPQLSETDRRHSRTRTTPTRRA